MWAEIIFYNFFSFQSVKSFQYKIIIKTTYFSVSSPITDDMFSSSRTFATVMYTNHLKSIITFPFRGIGNFALQVKQFKGRDKGYFIMASWEGVGVDSPPPQYKKIEGKGKRSEIVTNMM